MSAARGAVSKIMKRLAGRKLIVRSRTKRRADISLLREDGTGEPCHRPLGRTRGERWFQPPHAYWVEKHYETLSLPATTMLLVVLTQDDRFPLPEEHAPRWYGVSADSAGDGFRELISRELLKRHLVWEQDARSESGWTKRHLCMLIGSFSKVS